MTLRDDVVPTKAAWESTVDFMMAKIGAEQAKLQKGVTKLRGPSTSQQWLYGDCFCFCQQFWVEEADPTSAVGSKANIMHATHSCPSRGRATHLPTTLLTTTHCTEGIGNMLQLKIKHSEPPGLNWRRTSRLVSPLSRIWEQMMSWPCSMRLNEGTAKVLPETPSTTRMQSCTRSTSSRMRCSARLIVDGGTAFPGLCSPLATTCNAVMCCCFGGCKRCSNQVGTSSGWMQWTTRSQWKRRSGPWWMMW